MRAPGAEVSDLKEGLEMVEEKARSELGMVKPDEILVQVTRAGAEPAGPARGIDLLQQARPLLAPAFTSGAAPSRAGDRRLRAGRWRWCCATCA
jgi:hypothetical protein